mmetsp:Transcript_22881/g.52406  ORF Transcript_22881/g.52406 Transcript_22881/m.52406 type:complete len:430 (+) Transcript_22881:73-1362(+)
MGQTCVCPPKNASRGDGPLGSPLDSTEQINSRATESIPSHELKSAANVASDESAPTVPEVGTKASSRSVERAESAEVDAAIQDLHAGSQDAELQTLKEVESHLNNLRADQAWEAVKRLQLEQPETKVLEVLEGKPECTHPLRWLDPWGQTVDAIAEHVLEPAFPPSEEPRQGEPPGSGKWSVFHLTEKEDEGLRGELYSRYLPKLHGIELRGEMIMPGKYSEHFEGAMEVDLASEVCPTCYAGGERWSASIPGNFLFHLIVKLPKLPKFWCRDVVIHRQVFTYGKGLAFVEYSPKCFFYNRDGCSGGVCSRCNTYYHGGNWRNGIPGVAFPKCAVSGRDSAIGAYYFEACTLADGTPAVRFRSCQIADANTPKWLPVPQSWYPWAAAFICRRTLREFARARKHGNEVYERRVKERPDWYKPEWHHRSVF